MSNTIPTTKVTKDVLLRKMSVQLHEVLRKFAKDNGATENFAVKVHPDEKVEFSWEFDKNTFDDVQVGDMVMVSEGHRWVGPFLLQRIDDDDPTIPFLVSGVNAPVGWRWRKARHLTDEERAKIKRI